MFTQRHYEFLADAFAAELNLVAHDYGVESPEYWAKAVTLTLFSERLAQRLAADSPKFNRTQFLEAIQSRAYYARVPATRNK